MHLLKIKTTVLRASAYASYKLITGCNLNGCFSFTALCLELTQCCALLGLIRICCYRFILLFAGAAFSALFIVLYLACFYSLASFLL
jgi:hypothetical protein